MTIAVPTFTNRTTTYRIEQRMTEAVRQELIRRTRFKVVPEETGDVVMAGEVLSIGAVPVIFNQQGRGSAYTHTRRYERAADRNANRERSFSKTIDGRFAKCSNLRRIQ